MAGILKVDRLQSDSNLALSIASANVAFIDATGLKFVGNNLSLSGTNVISSGKVTYSGLPTGGIFQTKQTVKTDVQTGTYGQTWLPVNGLTVAITPNTTSSKILVFVDLKGMNENASVMRVRLLRNGTVVYQGDASGTRPRGFTQGYFGNAAFNNQAGPHLHSLSGIYLDSPASTSELTYSLEIGGDSTGLTYYINRTARDADTSTTDVRGASSITVMEVAG